MSREKVLSLPMKFFWLLNQNIDRISAQRDIRSLSIAAVSQDQEATSNLTQKLVMEIGNVVKKAGSTTDDGRDLAGIEELKVMARQRLFQ